jgi:hypothetical protein
LFRNVSRQIQSKCQGYDKSKLNPVNASFLCLEYFVFHNITARAALKFGSEAWVLKNREEQRLEAAQMKFLRHLLGITKLDKEKN